MFSNLIFLWSGIAGPRYLASTNFFVVWFVRHGELAVGFATPRMQMFQHIRSCARQTHVTLLLMRIPLVVCSSVNPSI